MIMSFYINALLDDILMQFKTEWTLSEHRCSAYQELLNADPDDIVVAVKFH